MYLSYEDRSLATASSSVLCPSSTRSQAIFNSSWSCSLTVTALKHVKLLVLNSKLHILHIMVVILKSLTYFLRIQHKLLGIPAPSERLALDVRTPATTSSPCALIKNSPISLFSPVAGSRVNATPVPDSSFKLPNTIGITLTAVPQEYGISLSRRYTFARGLSQERNTASIASFNCSTGSDGKSVPNWFLYSALNCSANSFKICCCQVNVVFNAFFFFHLVDELLEIFLTNFHNYVREHLDETSVGIIYETLECWIWVTSDHSCYYFVIQTKV